MSACLHRVAYSDPTGPYFPFFFYLSLFSIFHFLFSLFIHFSFSPFFSIFFHSSFSLFLISFPFLISSSQNSLYQTLLFAYLDFFSAFLVCFRLFFIFYFFFFSFGATKLYRRNWVGIVSTFVFHISVFRSWLCGRCALYGLSELVIVEPTKFKDGSLGCVTETGTRGSRLGESLSNLKGELLMGRRKIAL
ncbi:hypothetical protein BZA77DRAFT_150205 [Pyronema omphalodes]|nr:hypothetical protein BZA77DRAFT_150205 [Pyronema omphalodes]